MKKKYWIIGIVLFILFDIIVFFALYPSSPAKEIFDASTEDGGNGTESSWRFPNITFPWSPKEPSGSGGAGGGSGSGEGSGESGSGGSGEGTIPPINRNNHTLFVNSSYDLEVLVTYTVNGIVFNETKSPPFSIQVQEDTYACLTETTCSGTIGWLKEDGKTYYDFSDCSGFCEPDYFDAEILMDGNYSVLLRQYT